MILLICRRDLYSSSSWGAMMEPDEGRGRGCDFGEEWREEAGVEDGVEVGEEDDDEEEEEVKLYGGGSDVDSSGVRDEVAMEKERMKVSGW